VSSHQL
jgi:transposase InsO family protein